MFGKPCKRLPGGRMTLAQVQIGARVRVTGKWSGKIFASSMAGVGIHMGDELVVLKSAPFHGPVLIEVPATGVRIALGRGMAEKVIVEPADAPS